MGWKKQNKKPLASWIWWSRRRLEWWSCERRTFACKWGFNTFWFLFSLILICFDDGVFFVFCLLLVSFCDITITYLLTYILTNIFTYYLHTYFLTCSTCSPNNTIITITCQCYRIYQALWACFFVIYVLNSVNSETFHYSIYKD